MNSRSKMGISIALIFTIIAFILSVYDIFSSESGVTYSTGAWFTGFFTLIAVIFSISMYTAKSITPGVLNMLCIIIAGILTIFLGLYWILICLLVSLIGCIMHKASYAR
jgi:hypothetical protein